MVTNKLILLDVGLDWTDHEENKTKPQDQRGGGVSFYDCIIITRAAPYN